MNVVGVGINQRYSHVAGKLNVTLLLSRTFSLIPHASENASLVLQRMRVPRFTPSPEQHCLPADLGVSASDAFTLRARARNYTNSAI